MVYISIVGIYYGIYKYSWYILWYAMLIYIIVLMLPYLERANLWLDLNCGIFHYNINVLIATYCKCS